MPQIDPISDSYIDNAIKVAQEAKGKTTGEGLRELIKSMRDRLNARTTISTLPPSGVPNDGEEWIIYNP
jgi:hypothetical protein